MKIVQNIKTETKIRDKGVESLISRTGPIKQSQFNRLVGYNIETISKNIIRAKIVEWKDDNFNLNISGVEILSYKKYPKQKILHNVLLIETYLLLRNKIGGTLYNTFFDGEINMRVNSSVLQEGNEEVSPDIAIFRGNRIICIEMDMGTESYDVLRNKRNTYIKLQKKLGTKYRISVIFSSYAKRNISVQKYQIFQGVDVSFIDLDTYVPFLQIEKQK